MNPEQYVKNVLDQEYEEFDNPGSYHCGHCWRQCTEKLLLEAMAEERKACREIALSMAKERVISVSACFSVNDGLAIARRIEMRGESDE